MLWPLEEGHLQPHARHRLNHLDVQPMGPAALLSDHVAAGAHGGAVANLTTPVAVDAQAIDSRLLMGRPYHIPRAGRKIVSRQSFRYRPFPLALGAVHPDQMALIVPAYVARAAGRADENQSRPLASSRYLIGRHERRRIEAAEV
jgi:hypothetical protein